FQAEDGIRDATVTGVQTCALPIYIEAQSVIRGYRVTAMIEGPLSHPTTSVGSEPSLPQADVVSLILTGTLSSTDTSTSVLAQSRSEERRVGKGCSTRWGL